VSRTNESLRTLSPPSGGEQRAVTYVSDHPLERPRRDVTRAVLVVHGTERDGDRYWRALARAARRAGPEVRARSYLLAPQFFTRGDLKDRGLDGAALAWRGRDWKEGGESRTDDGLSSFEALDALLTELGDRERFPNLRTVVLVGHSAGAQLLQRHAAASPASEALERAGLHVRYVVINPSSYLYLDATRPGFGPAGGFAPPPRSVLLGCPDYNAYKYGLDQPNAYVGSLPPDGIKARYGARRVTYLIGEEDDDPESENLDRSCAATLQGRTRLERGQAYWHHLTQVYGEDIRARHVLEVVPGLGHEGARILRSEVGLRWIFDVLPRGPRERDR
jgi:pimeloyl-ACP methyl ester carboxylesterase